MGQAAAAAARADGRSGEIAWRGIETDTLRDDWNQERLIRNPEKYDGAEMEAKSGDGRTATRDEFLIKTYTKSGPKIVGNTKYMKRKKT